MTDPEIAARLDCVNHLTALFSCLQALALGNMKGSPASSKGTEALPKGQQMALTEDWQLQGFLPLQQCHSKLLFERQDLQVSSDLPVLC